MQVTEVGQDFLQLLKKSQLLDADDLQDASVTIAQLTDPTREEIAQVMVEDGYLTRFQAERLLKGAARGLVIDGYKVLELLGAGGMGCVYIAEEIETKWRVALKVLPRDARDDPGTLARFRLEAQAGMRLKHPNIVHTYSLGHAEDIYGQVHYVVMELVRGVNLFELLLMKRQLDVGQACDIVMQTAEGLSHAHQQGLVHRDVKPENLLVCTDGTVKILDFGLAMLDENDEEFSMAMIFGQNRLGTADYISPEQYINSYAVDERADVYSLGGTLYFALTGKVPFPYKTSAQKLRGHLKKRPTPVQQLRPEIPKRVAAIVAKMMAKHPSNRIQTADEVVDLLRPYAERQSLSINFRSVLNARAAYAKRRQADQQLAPPPSKTDHQPAIPNPETEQVEPASKPRQSTIETIVSEETRIDQRKERPRLRIPPPMPQPPPPEARESDSPPASQEPTSDG